MFNLEAHIENRQNRRLANEPALVAKVDRQLDAIDALIGKLVRDGKTVFYINQLKKNGQPNGKTVEFKYREQASDYLVRNRYV